MNLSTKVGSFVRTTAQAAYLHPLTRLGFRAEQPKTLSRAQTAAYFVKGLGYHALDLLRPTANLSLPRMELETTRLDKRPRQVLLPQIVRNSSSKDQIVQMVGAGQNGGPSKSGTQDVVEATADALMCCLASKTHSYSRKILIERYSQDYANDISAGRLPDLSKNGEILNQALELLRVQKKIDVDGRGHIRHYHQSAAISSVVTTLDWHLSGVTSLHALMKTASEVIGSSRLFENAKIYLHDEKTGAIRIVAGESQGSTFEEWKQPDENELFGKIFAAGSPDEHFEYFRDIVAAAKETGPMLKDRGARYQQHFEDPAEVVFCARKGPELGGGVVLMLNEWQKKDEGIATRSFYSESDGANRPMVDAQIKNLLLAVTEAMKRVMAQPKNKTKSVKEIWEAEEKTRAMPLRSPVKEWDNEGELSFWAKYSKFIHVLGLARIHKRMVREIIDLLRLENNQTVVFAGCGIGNEIVEANRIFSDRGIQNAQIKGFDVTQEMIDRAKTNADLKSVEFSTHDWCEKLPFENNSIDKIASVLVFGYLADPKKALAETLRVLKPGGVFSLTVTAPKYNSAFLFLRGIGHSLLDHGLMETIKILPAGLKSALIWREISKKIRRGFYGGYTPDGLRDFLMEQGFVNVTATLSSGGRIFTVAAGQKRAA